MECRPGTTMLNLGVLMIFIALFPEATRFMIEGVAGMPIPSTPPAGETAVPAVFYFGLIGVCLVIGLTAITSGIRTRYRRH